LAVFGWLYLGFVVVLLSIGRRGEARAVAGFVPDCLRPFQRPAARPRCGPATLGAAA
jgi:hypothetical protein